MKYKVINRFKDLKDNNKIYEVGEEYPKGKTKPTKKRIEELTSVHPKHGVAFIEEVEKDSKSKE